MHVQGKTAIITGAGSGINLAFARLLLSKSCNVIIGDLQLTPSASSLLSEEHPDGARCLFKPTDVTDWKQLSSLFDFARDNNLGSNGAPDIVVPGAGVYEPPWSAFFTGDPEGEAKSRYRSIDINLVHPIKLTRMAISEFLRAGKEQGTIIHVSSVAGQVPRFAAPVYGATKAGINGFIRCMADLEENFNIRVSGVAPGVIKTPLWTDHPEKLKVIDESDPDWASPEEVADGMMMLVECSDLPGGTVLEVGKGQKRVVEALNDKGPAGPGHFTAYPERLDQDCIQVLQSEREAASFSRPRPRTETNVYREDLDIRQEAAAVAM